MPQDNARTPESNPAWSLSHHRTQTVDLRAYPLGHWRVILDLKNGCMYVCLAVDVCQKVVYLGGMYRCMYVCMYVGIGT